MLGKFSKSSIRVTAVILFAAIPLVGQSTESASSVQLWSAPVGYYQLAVSPTGAPTLIATAFGELQKVDPQTGAATVVLPYQTHNVGLQSSIWVSNSGDLVANSGDFVISAFQDFAAFSVLSLSPVGSANLYYSMGCCQYWAFGLDSPGGKGYYQANGVLYTINLTNGTQMGPFSSLQDGFGYASVASPNVVYTAGIGGDVNQVDPTVSNYPNTFVSVASGQSLSPGAIANDGSLVVATVPSPCNFVNLCPGSLARVLPGPSLKWSFPVGTITPPVIGSQGYIFIGVQITAAANSTPYQGAIQAYDQNGNKVWTTNLDPGLYASDVIVGNDGLVYAVASDAPYQTYSTQGELIELDQATGQKKLTITNLPGASELILFNGVVYVTGINLTAIPVTASGYDAQAPWPVRFHDNQRTANATSPQNLGNTQVADQTRDNSLYAELGAASNVFSGSLAATSFIGDGSGLTNINAVNANHATSADAANNAVNLGGVSATNYARLDIGNAFSGNQNVMGTLTANAGLVGQGTCSGGSCTAGVTGQGYFGLLGTGSVYGAYTTATSGPGIHAESSSDAGVFGKGVIGVSGLTQNSAGIAGVFNAYNGAKILSGLNSGTEVFSVDTYGTLTSSAFSVPPAGTASGTNTGFNSGAFDQAASVYNGSTAVAETFRWQVEPTNQGTPSAAASMHLLFGATSAPTETGLTIKPDGTISFVPRQTFPGAGGITGVTAGAGLSGGGTSGTVNLGIPGGGVSNAMLANSSLNVSVGAGITGGGVVPLGGTTTVSLAPQTCAAGSAVTAHPFTCTAFPTFGANTFTGTQICTLPRFNRGRTDQWRAAREQQQ